MDVNYDDIMAVASKEKDHHSQYLGPLEPSTQMLEEPSTELNSMKMKIRNTNWLKMIRYITSTIYLIIYKLTMNV